MSRFNEVGSHKTSIAEVNGYTQVVYHSTPVVKFNENEIILNTGGYYTNTTKKRMNQASNQFGLGFMVWQEKFTWYVSHNGQIVSFKKDTMLLAR